MIVYLAVGDEGYIRVYDRLVAAMTYDRKTLMAEDSAILVKRTRIIWATVGEGFGKFLCLESENCSLRMLSWSMTVRLTGICLT